MNNNYKNYYKNRLIESIISEVSNPGEASTSEQPVADIRGFLRDLLKRFKGATPVAVPAKPKVPAWILRYSKKHRFIVGINGNIKWGRVTTPNGTTYDVVWDPARGRWFFKTPEGDIYPVGKDWRPPPGFGENGGGQSAPFNPAFFPIGVGIPAGASPENDEPEELPPFGREYPYDPYYNPAGEDVNDPNL